MTEQESSSMEVKQVDIVPVVVDEAINPIEEAKKVMWENKKLLDEIKAERIRIEKATAEMLINGRSYAGQKQPIQETAEEKWEREAKIRYAGFGMDPTPRR